jgi:signal transduction histidine kinase
VELEELRIAARETQAAFATEREAREALERSEVLAQDDARQATERAERLAEELESASEINTEMNRRLQEVEARRALEVAEDEGRAHIDELLTATQERLAGQSEKLMTAEEHGRELERQVAIDAERIEVLEAELRQHQMADQMRELQAQKHDAREDDASSVIEDRRGSTPFIKEMSMDAQKTISRMIGVTQLLKHKHGGKEQAQLIQQLTAQARRLDATIRDLSDVDSLVTGAVALERRNTDLESLIRRVVEESGVEGEHDVRIEAEPVSLSIDRTRTEQIVQALLRSASDRTPTGKTIAVRLLRDKQGAMIVVEEPEAVSEAALSPMVRRLADVQGGWAKVGDREGGGTAFQVFLPATDRSGAVVEGVEEDASPATDGSDEAPSDGAADDPNHWVKAEQALVAELRQLSQNKAGK